MSIEAQVSQIKKGKESLTRGRPDRGNITNKTDSNMYRSHYIMQGLLLIVTNELRFITIEMVQ